MLGSLVVADTDLPLLRGTPLPLAVAVTGGAGQLAGPAGLAQRLGLTLTRLEIGLRDLDDLASNARRVVAAVDAARADGVLDEDLPVHVSIPDGAEHGWLAAADELAAAELGLVLRADAGPSSLAGRIDAALDRETPYVLHGCTRLIGDGSVPGLLNALVSTRLAFDGAGPDAVTVALAQEDAAALAATPELAGARRWLRSGVVPDTGPLLAELAGLRA